MLNIIYHLLMKSRVWITQIYGGHHTEVHISVESTEC